MKKNRSIGSRSLRRLVEGGVIAAMYTALSLCLAPLSFGPVQLRVAEMLTLLPVFTPAAVPGLAVGCAITNAVGLTMGANVAGAWDILCGTLATLAAAIVTRLWRNVRIKGLPVPAALPPILFNGIVVGLELTLVLFPSFTWPLFLVTAGQVAAGQAVVCLVGGMLLCGLLERSGAAKRLFR